MATVEPLAPLLSPPAPLYGGAFYEYNRHGPEFQFGAHPPPRRAPEAATPPDRPERARLPDGVHGDFDVYA